MRVRIGGAIAIWYPGMRSAASRSRDNSASVRARSSGHTVASADPLYNGLPAGDATAQITDNDVAGVTIVASPTAATEGGAGDTYTIVLDSQPTSNVTITITPDAQTTRTPASVTFTPANWDTPRNVDVDAVDDFVNEGAHAGTVTHTASSGDANYAGIAIGDITVNITDNDAP